MNDPYFDLIQTQGEIMTFENLNTVRIFDYTFLNFLNLFFGCTQHVEVPRPGAEPMPQQ